MDDFLERGTEIRPGVRLRGKKVFGTQWQIYNTTEETSVLAVSRELYGEWTERFGLPDGLFLPEDRFGNCRVFEARENYLVSSLMKGPFPVNTAQIEAFSASYKSAREKGFVAEEKDALYLEEYSFILPAEDKGLPEDMLYGHWISGGIDVEKESFGTIIRTMSWIDPRRMLRYFEIAGFTDIVLENNSDDGREKTFVRQLPGERSGADAWQKILAGGGKNNGFAAATGEFSLPGRPALEQFFRENIIDVVLNRERYARMGISFPGATVLYGPPGTGKTYAVERLAEYLGMEPFRIDSGTIGSSYIHETSRRISEVFGKAMASAPSILIIDEMEAFLSERSGAGPSGMHHMEEVAEFLRRIPEAAEKGVLIFAMTNMLDSIDPAVIRRGRFDHMIKVDYATKEEMVSFLSKRFEDLPVAEDVEIEQLAAGLAGRPMSDAAFVLKEAGRLAVRRRLDEIDKACLNDAMDELPKKENKPTIGF